MLRDLFRAFIFSLFILQIDAASSYRKVPVVVAPPVLRLGATNRILVTPLSVEVTGGNTVDIRVQIHQRLTTGKTVSEDKVERGKSRGHPHPVAFKVHPDAKEADVTINIQGHAEYQIRLLVAPDLRTIHMKTDKGFYKPGETVNLRAVPITTGGHIYTEDIEYALVNPDGYELTRHITATPGVPLPLTFTLPEHLFFGEWKIKARPTMQGSQPLLNFAVSFQVTDYVLPPFVLDFVILDGDTPNKTRLSASAHYFHGDLVSGALALNCYNPDRATVLEPEFHRPLAVGE
ncbi:unnamed protein product, partial [Mesorhabditis spiculigera]